MKRTAIVTVFAIATEVAVGASELAESANGTERAAEAAGLNTTELAEIRANASEMRGRAVAELAVGIAAPANDVDPPGHIIRDNASEDREGENASEDREGENASEDREGENASEDREGENASDNQSDREDRGDGEGNDGGSDEGNDGGSDEGNDGGSDGEGEGTPEDDGETPEGSDR